MLLASAQIYIIIYCNILFSVNKTSQICLLQIVYIQNFTLKSTIFYIYIQHYYSSRVNRLWAT